MPIQRLHVGPRLSQVAIHGNTIYTAGIVADDPDQDAESQTRQILGKIDEYLGEAGSDKSRLLSVTIWLADMGDYKAMNSAWDAWIDKANTPPRACVEAKLAAPQYRVEIRVVAALD